MKKLISLLFVLILSTSTYAYDDIVIGSDATHTVAESDTFNYNNFTMGNNSTLNIFGHATIHGYLLTGNNCTINVYGTLLILGDFDANNNTIVNAYGIMSVYNFIVKNNANITITGLIAVDGDFTANNNGAIEGDGVLYVEGEINIGNNTYISDGINVVIPPVNIVTNIIGVNALCFGDTNGAAYLTVFDGVPPYTYLWSNGSTNEDINNLAPGNYYVTITDFDDHTAIDSITINEPDQLESGIIPINVSCNGYDDGGGNLFITGGTYPYTYLWSNASTNEDLSNVTAGEYFITITDGNSCSTTDSVTITEPEILVSSVTDTDVLCNEGEDGSGELAVTGGTLPYSYKWSNGTFNKNVTNVPTGTYYVTITDGNSCTKTDSATINEPTAITHSVITISSNCGFADGSATVSPSGGTPPYTYLWDANTENQTNITAINLSAGSYTVTITDNHNCIKVATANISDIGAGTLSFINIIHNLCFGETLGQAEAEMIGGTAPFSYSWTNGDPDSLAQNLTAGFYSVVVTDDIGCIASDEIEITEPTKLSTFISNRSNISCNGNSDGNAIITPSGGTPPYAFLWSDIPGTTDSTVTDLTANIYYYVTITDNNLCSTTDSVKLTEPSLLSSIITDKQNVTCNGYNNGSATVSPIGGTKPYTYLWSDVSETTASTINNLEADIDYFVTITDANSCTTTDKAKISEPNILLANISDSTNITCNGLADGVAISSPVGGTTPYSYLWSKPRGNTNFIVTGLIADVVYNVTVTDANGCANTDSIMLSEPDIIDASISSFDNIECYGDNSGNVNTSITGGTSPFTYLWSNGENTANLKEVYSGDYSVTITDHNNCTDFATVFIFEPEQLKVDSIALNSISCIGCNDGSIKVFIEGGLEPYFYEWSNGKNTSTILNIKSGEYMLTVTDGNDCEITETFELEEIAKQYLKIPTAFTPNNDGKNDKWLIEYINLYPEAKIKVFDRWGNGVFESVNNDEPWDGTYENGKQAPFGGYIYIIDLNDGSKLIKGTITILR